jgi:hypothetical protein
MKLADLSPRDREHCQRAERRKPAVSRRVPVRKPDFRIVAVSEPGESHEHFTARLILDGGRGE